MAEPAAPRGLLRCSSGLQFVPRLRIGAAGISTAEGWLGSRGRPEQAARASVVKRRGGAEVAVGCSGAVAT